jgi:SAM-dependent methyltransferase
LAAPPTSAPLPASGTPLPDSDQLTGWRRQIVDDHESLVTTRGEGWSAFWGSEASQHSRYRVFLDELQLCDANVLEVGCGFGDFLVCAAERNLRPRRYLGVDLSERIVAAAQKRHPEHTFLALDILRETPAFEADFVIASGIMAVPLADYENYVVCVLKRFFELGRRGFALNFLSTATRTPDGVSQYVDPAWLFALFQRHIDWSGRLIHDYRQNDFTLVYRRASST